MSNKVKDLSGLKFGKLTAIKVSSRDRFRHILWECECECGVVKSILSTSLLRGISNSCGCGQLEWAKKLNYKHGRSKQLIYKVYRGMLNRCNNPNVERHKHYGGRGISVCARWQESFENFFEDMGTGYKKGLSLDRINVNGNYEPSNCRWATQEQQSNNKTNTRVYTLAGKSLNIEGWARVTGSNKRTIYTRIQRGWPLNEAIYGEPVKSLDEIKEYLVF